MDPVTAMLAIGTATKAVGSIVQGNAASAASKANAKIADQNATIVGQQASAREDQQRRRSAMELGRQAAAFAQSGVDPTSGSAMRVAADSAAQAELDALNLRYEGQMQAFGYTREAAIERQRARYARNAGYFGAVTSILGGGAQAYGMRPTTATSSFGGDAATFGPGSGYEWGAP